MYIIGISGKAESGKTTFGEMLKKSFEEKAQRVLMINYADAVKHIARQYYNWNGEKDQYGRSLLQKIGTEMGRNMIDEDIWVIIVELFINLMKDDFDVFIIGDCRFPNEIEYWEDKNLFHKALISVHYFEVVAKSNRIKDLLSQHSQNTNETIVGAKFANGPENDPRHVITHCVNKETILEAVQQLNECIKLLQNFFSGEVDFISIEKIN